MKHMCWLRRLATCERGVNIVEYLGITGISLLLAGLIMAAVTTGRYRIGAAMAAIHNRQIASFEQGMGGTANIDASLFPKAPKTVNPLPVNDPPTDAPPLVPPPVVQRTVAVPAVLVLAVVQQVWPAPTITVPPVAQRSVRDLPVLQAIVAVPAVVQRAVLMLFTPEPSIDIPLITQQPIVAVVQPARANPAR